MRKFSDKINENNELKSYNYKMFVEIEGNLVSTSESDAGEMLDKLVDVIDGADPAIVVTNYQIEEINELGQAPIDADITEVNVNESNESREIGYVFVFTGPSFWKSPLINIVYDKSEEDAYDDTLKEFGYSREEIENKIEEGTIAVNIVEI